MSKHPATYTDALLPVMAGLLPVAPANILDPFCGTGKVVCLEAWLPLASFYGCEIEEEWAAQARANRCHCITADSRNMVFYNDRTFDAICTSPVYGSRMSDHHNARDASPRHTYRHTLGRPLTPGNAGGMQWGEEYRALHVAVWTECRRVLKPGGIFILNIKDHFRKGVRQEVSNWHAVTLLKLGFVCTARVHVPCPGQRHGSNGNLRMSYESVLQFKLAAERDRIEGGFDV